MEIVERIRSADSAPKVLSALSTYVESLRHFAAIPDWLLRLPLKDADDVGQRMMALTAVVHLASQNLRNQDCKIAKDALQVFAAATWRLRTAQRRNDLH
jgi:hypothetical protein